MPRSYQYFIFILAISVSLFACHSRVITSQKGVPNPVKPFSLSDIELLDGPFKHAEELNINSLLKYDPDRTSTES